MIFRRLIEFNTRAAAARASAEGIAVSVVAHLAIVGGAFISTRPVVPAVPPSPTETISFAEFLIPKDQMSGSRPQREQISWESPDTKQGAGFDELKDERKEPDRLKVDMAKGEEVEIDKGDAPPPPQAPIALGDSIKTELEVDSAVVRVDDSAAPPYPESMLRRRIEGSVLVQYVVDTLGRADTASFRVLLATHVDFAKSVKSTLPFMRFHPAMMGARRVPQLVEQPFLFKIVDSVRVAHEPRKPPS